MSTCNMKAVVFDLDDTIGHFEELGIFTSGLKIFANREVHNEAFFKLLALFPKFIRPGILSTLRALKRAKAKDPCLKVIIYTNNMGEREWTLRIKRYLERTIGSPGHPAKLFDRVITAYRPGKAGCRTTHRKTYSDLLRCTGLPKGTKVLFLDDQLHTAMKTPDVTYLHLHPYNYAIPFPQMVHRFINSPLGQAIPKKRRPPFVRFMVRYLGSKMGQYQYVVRKTHISKRDMQQKAHIEKQLKFFLRPRKKKHRTRRAKKRSRKRGTRRKRKED